MSARSVFIAPILLILFSSLAKANPICDPGRNNCWLYPKGRSSTAPAYPSTNSRLNLNPSAVPTEKGLGLETIYYNTGFEFAITQGLGRVGAAISPSNAEESFFGPPSLESEENYLKRQRDKEKYASQKISLATAFNLFKNKGSGLKRFELNLGVSGKYNKVTGSAWPGGGLSGVLGPLTFGYAVAADEHLQTFTSGREEEERYLTETYSLGIYLTNFIFDYSLLRLYPEGGDTIPVSLLTSTVLIKRLMLTASMRTEESDRMVYDAQTDALKEQRLKTDYFAGAQLSLTNHIMVALFYNYYRLKEISVGATLFF